VSWYLRSAADRDTHYGPLRDGRTHALCGAQFRPIELPTSGGPALPGLPPDGGQVCVICYRETLRHRSQ
jgi:hypothetical protein